MRFTPPLGTGDYTDGHTEKTQEANPQEESDLWLNDTEFQKQEELRRQLKEPIERSPDYTIVAPLELLNE